MASVQERPGLKPYCSCLRILSTALFNLFRTTMHRTLLGIDSNVIPLQFEQLLRSPFFGSGIIVPIFHSSGICSFSQISLHNFCSVSIKYSPPCFIISGWIPSDPGALLFLSLMTAILISSLVIGPVSISSMSGICSLISGLSIGSGWFKTELKCSIHLSAISFSLLSVFPSLLLIGTCCFFTIVREFFYYSIGCFCIVSGSCCLSLFRLFFHHRQIEMGCDSFFMFQARSPYRLLVIIIKPLYQ